VDDIEHEFNIDDQKHNHSAEAMLHGKMSYGRGPEDDENSQFPAVIAGGRSRPVRFANHYFFLLYKTSLFNRLMIILHVFTKKIVY